MRTPVLVTSGLALAASASAASTNVSYTNPIILGYNADASCAFVPELNNTYFCCTDTFVNFPGLPVYASKDLINWKHVSNVFNRAEQIPGFNTVPNPVYGIFATTVRYHNGALHIASFSAAAGIDGAVLWNTTDPYSDAGWGMPTVINTPGIDPDLFWREEDDRLFMSTSVNRFEPVKGIVGSYPALSNVTTPNEVTNVTRLWNGIAGEVPGDSPEGPHIYKRDGSYYLMIAEGGSQQNHSATIARSSNLEGPYESYANNPIITARQTDNYFQSVGHCDLLNDASNNSWAVCISRRSGPGYEYYPMSRETSLTPVTWNAEGWPVLDPIRGNMTGPLPTPDRDGVPGDGLFTDAEDDYATFDAIPRHFLYYGVPNQNGTTYNISSGSLVLSGVPNSTVPGLSFIGRRQISSLFTFNVSMDFALTKEGDQVGTSMFTFPGSRIDLGVTRVNGSQVLYFAPMNKTIETSPAPIYIPFSQNSTTFQIRALNQTTLSFAATVNGTMQTIEHALTSIVSTDFSGSLLGVYANGDSNLKASVKNWKYRSDGQIRTNDGKVTRY